MSQEFAIPAPLSEPLPALYGHRLLLIESTDILAEIGATLHHTYDNRLSINYSQNVPSNLQQLMNQENIDLAIIHPQLLQDEAPILQAHQDGKIVVVLKSKFSKLLELEAMFDRLEQAGILSLLTFQTSPSLILPTPAANLASQSSVTLFPSDFWHRKGAKLISSPPIKSPRSNYFSISSLPP